MREKLSITRTNTNKRIHEGSQPAINPLSVQKQTRELTSDHSQLSIIPVQKLPTVDNSSQFSISSPVIRPHSGGMLLCPTASVRVVQFNVALRPQRLYGLLRTGSPGRPPRLHTAPEFCGQLFVQCCFTILYYAMLVQRFEPQGRRFTNFHYDYYYVHRGHTEY